MSNRVLAIYLRDHLAGATAGVALAQRVARNNANERSGEALAQVAAEIAADREVLERLTAELGVQSSLLKNTGAWAIERLSRLRPGRRTTPAGSAFQRMHELEMLALGIAGKHALWDALRRAPDVASRVDLDRLATRAQGQREVVESARLARARQAFA